MHSYLLHWRFRSSIIKLSRHCQTFYVFVSLLTGLGAVPVVAGTVTLSFEGFPDSTVLTSQYAGVSFVNTVIFSAGISLNEFEFPPHSGVNVASDNGGPISISFASPILSFAGYFTYVEPLILRAFNAADVQVASAVSTFSTNDALFGDSGSSPNELLQVLFADCISRVTITGDPFGGSFAMDDATITMTTSVPEPSSTLLLLASVATIAVSARRKHLS
jgi:hypothetical protein